MAWALKRLGSMGLCAECVGTGDKVSMVLEHLGPGPFGSGNLENHPEQEPLAPKPFASRYLGSRPLVRRLLGLKPLGRNPLVLGPSGPILLDISSLKWIPFPHLACQARQACALRPLHAGFVRGLLRA